MKWTIFIFDIFWLVFDKHYLVISFGFLFQFERTDCHLLEMRNLFLIWNLRTPKLFEAGKFEIFKNVYWKINLIDQNAIFFSAQLIEIINKVISEIIRNQHHYFPIRLVNGKNGFFSDQIHFFQMFEISKIWSISRNIKLILVVFLLIKS